MCNTCTPNSSFAVPFRQAIKREKVSLSSWPYFLTQAITGQEGREGGGDKFKNFDLLCQLPFALLPQATADRHEREKAISQSKWNCPLASQEELAVYPGMPNVQKIYLGKGSGKCMFLFYPK